MSDDGYDGGGGGGGGGDDFDYEGPGYAQIQILVSIPKFKNLLYIPDIMKTPSCVPLPPAFCTTV
jgi:hypothetical protein